MTGQVFGGLTVIKPTAQRDSDGSVRWLCRCSCGKTTTVRSNTLKRGEVQSCGCLRKEKIKERNKKCNVFEIKGDAAIGYTMSGDTFLIDAEDLERVNKYCWHKNKRGYIRSRIGSKIVNLHRFVLDINDKRIIDHKNRDKTDNRKINLRVATTQQNNMNRGAYQNSTTGTKSVYKSSNGKRYIAIIGKDGINIYLGTFDTLEEAKQARIKKRA